MSDRERGWLTPAEFCVVARISRRTLRRYIQNGVVPVVRLSRRAIRIPDKVLGMLECRRAVV